MWGGQRKEDRQPTCWASQEARREARGRTNIFDYPLLRAHDRPVLHLMLSKVNRRLPIPTVRSSKE